MFAHLHRTDAFIIDCQKLRPFSAEEARELLAAMRALDGQASLNVVPHQLSDDTYVLNIQGTSLGVTYRSEDNRVVLLTCERRVQSSRRRK
jgi:hypothetical protein